MERRIKTFMFSLLVVNSLLWLNEIKFYPSFCFPKFHPINKNSKQSFNFTKVTFIDNQNQEVNTDILLLNFKPFDKKFYTFSIKEYLYTNSLDSAYYIPYEPSLQKDSISL